MDRLDFKAVALLKARLVFGNPEMTQATPSPAAVNDSLAGTTFLELEPDLVKEAGLYTR